MKDFFPNRWSRRDFVRRILCAGGCVPLGVLASSLAPAQSQLVFPAPAPQPGSLSPEDDPILDDLEKTTFQFFWEQASPVTRTGQGPVQCARGRYRIVASIAATGFGLTALCIGEHRGSSPTRPPRTACWRLYDACGESCRTIAGSSITGPTSIPGNGYGTQKFRPLTPRSCFVECSPAGNTSPRPEVTGTWPMSIMSRVEWNWLSEDTSLLPHGWTPEIGFLPYRWDNYSELMMMYLLGLGSESYPLHSETWTAWKRLKFEYDGLRYVGSFAPLFVHQYSQAWFDFRGKRDKFADYFRIPLLPRTLTAAFVWSGASNSRVIATSFGGSPPRIHLAAT